MTENREIIIALATLLQTAVQKLGPLEDEIGEAIKKVIEEDNFTKIVLTGAWIEKCLAEGKWIK